MPDEMGERVDWDALDAAGHQFTMVDGLGLGQTKYICENCGAFMIIRSMGPGFIDIWHHPHRDDRRCEERRGKGFSLKEKMAKLHQRMYDRIDSDRD